MTSELPVNDADHRQILGRDVAVREWRPAGAADAAVVLVHGLGEHSGRYQRTGSVLADEGFHVVAPDLPGFGLSGGRRGDVASMDVWLDVLAELIEGTAVSPTHLLGHSMGGLVALAYTLSGRPAPDRLVLSAPALDASLPAYQKVAATVLGRVVPRMRMKVPISGSQLSRDPAVGEAYFADPLVDLGTTMRLGMVLLRSIEDVRARLGALRVPTLVIHGAGDTLVPPAASEALTLSPYVERRVLEGLRHEAFNEPEGPQVVAEVARWLRAAVS